MLLVAIFVILTMGIVSLIHFYWALGGRYGLESAGPTPLSGAHFIPSSGLIFTVACLMLGLALLPLVLVNSAAGLGPLTQALPILGYVVSVGFILRAVGDFKYVGLFKRVYNSRFARLDSLYFSPLILLLGMGYGLLALNFRSVI